MNNQRPDSSMLNRTQLTLIMFLIATGRADHTRSGKGEPQTLKEQTELRPNFSRLQEELFKL